MSSLLPVIKLKSGFDHYAVIGNPISHSRSPQIHQLFAEQTDQNLIYQAIESPLDQFTNMIRQFRDAGGLGLNVTVPFKQQAWELATHRGEIAERAGAVNTLLFKNNLDQLEIHGHNTDGLGLVRDIIHNYGQTIADKRILILGAGGAVRGVLEPLLKEKPGSCVIANRTLSKAVELVDLFSDLTESESLRASEYSHLGGSKFDLIINGTSASLDGKLPPLKNSLLHNGAMCYDMMYSKKPTAFVSWGLEQNAALSVDGLGMLIEQAAESFYMWRGIRPETKSVISLFRT
ncbi:MAG: shikimate dehydrogenase [Gammaproteobacteria bacterium]